MSGQNANCCCLLFNCATLTHANMSEEMVQFCVAKRRAAALLLWLHVVGFVKAICTDVLDTLFSHCCFQSICLLEQALAVLAH